MVSLSKSIADLRRRVASAEREIGAGRLDASRLRADLDALRTIVPTKRHDGTFTKEELCVNPPYEGGRRNGQRPHNHDVKPVPADTLDGKYCTACYERMRRSEARANAAA